ncbi:hypothetical protein, partial [Thermoleptolyngbya sp.]
DEEVEGHGRGGKREEGRTKNEEGRGKNEERRGKNEERRGKNEERRGKREEGSFFLFLFSLFLFRSFPELSLEIIVSSLKSGHSQSRASYNFCGYTANFLYE